MESPSVMAGRQNKYIIISIDLFSNISLPCRREDGEMNLYTIVYNITAVPNGFMDSFYGPLPIDERLVRLKMVVDNAYLSYYASLGNRQKAPPKLFNITTQPYPTPPSRLTSNANVISLFGTFYLYFPPMILFAILLLDVVKEKENMLKSYTNLYGLSLVGYWLSWVIIAFLSSFILIAEMSFLGRYVFKFDVFYNTNIIPPFSLFFLFTLSMQFIGMYLACVLPNSQSATAVSYGIILMGLVVQCFFTNYGVIYFFYATNLENYWLLVKIVRFVLHFYPPFLFSKGYLDIVRVCSYHFDGPSLQWKAGRYFYLSDTLTKQVGALRIGLTFDVDSLAVTFFWFYLLIFICSFLIIFSEIKARDNKISFSCRSFQSYLKMFKDLYSFTSVKKLNIKKQLMESNINKMYERYLKYDQKQNPADESLSFIIRENHVSVNIEKKNVAMLNKKRGIPNGIRVMAVGKKYENDFEALFDVNLEINKGEVFTILGPNGAGKSTLINILTSQMAGTHGYAKVGPFSIHSDLFIDSIYVKRLIGICSQFDYLWEELTIYETLFLYARLRGIKEHLIEHYIDDKIAEVGLEKKKNEQVSKLSGGMRRRLSICISTLGDPLIIFMDEPTSGLDPNNRRKIWNLINKIKKNRVIVLTTHIMDEAEYLSDRLGIVVGGKFRFIGNCTEMRQLYWDGIILTLRKLFS